MLRKGARISMKLVVRSVPDTIIIIQYMCLNICMYNICISAYVLAGSAAHSLLFTLTIFSLISSKVKVKSEHLFTLQIKLHRPSKNIQLYSHSHGPFIK